MIKHLRASFAQLGGARAVLAMAAIAWGMNVLAVVQQEKELALAALDAELEARLGKLVDQEPEPEPEPAEEPAA